ncbi:hypothetical protein NOMA109596_16300 [Nocardioides marinus]|uniref:Uncharacterized protein n=1 Tax=Nocardioides marinus TaxID=374514 RepID=A0A7Y9YJG7_9ACTN|nr:hypothetical protein [Nocardioides marinus]NYI11435.1 hypothetical protein [Nocardioides marinus]
MTPSLTPELAAWVVPSSLGVLAVLLSTYLVLSVRRRRLAEVRDLEDVEALPPQADDPDVRVLRRQVDVLTRTLAEWDAEQRVARPSDRPAGRVPDGASDPSSTQPVDEPVDPAPERAAVPPVDPSTPLEPGPSGPGQPVAPPVGASTAYAALSRELAATGDATGAVLAQWAADLQVLRPALGAHGVDLARAVSDVRLEEPVAALRACREAALGLVRTAGSVRALLAPLDHLGDLSDLSGVADLAGADGAGVPSALPQPLLDLLPADQRERLAAAGLAG